MTALAGPFLIVCCILGLGGIAKVISPVPARSSLRAVGVPAPSWGVRALGLAELAVAGAAVVSGGPVLPILVGGAYLAFAAFVVLVLRTDAATSCGCFGTTATPPSRLHVVVNLASAAIALASVGTDGLPAILDAQAGAGVPLLALVVVGTYGLFLVLTALPVLLAPPRTSVVSFSVRPSPGART